MSSKRSIRQPDARVKTGDHTPIDLVYASRDDAARAGMPPDEHVLGGLRIVLTAIVLLPCVVGLILIVVCLTAGAGVWAGLFGDS